MTGDNSLFDLSGRIAVVTGGNGGIGQGSSVLHRREPPRYRAY